MSQTSKHVTIRQAKSDLSRLIERALRGEEVVIHRGGEPVVRLVPVNRPEARRKFGAFKGKVRVPASFFKPMPEEELAAWEPDRASCARRALHAIETGLR